jgi:hypothetical protein
MRTQLPAATLGSCRGLPTVVSNGLSRLSRAAKRGHPSAFPHIELARYYFLRLSSSRAIRATCFLARPVVERTWHSCLDGIMENMSDRACGAGWQHGTRSRQPLSSGRDGIKPT